MLALPAGLALDAGRWSLAVVLFAFVVIGFMALALAEVASRFEVTGGPQVYAQIAFGPLTGFTVGWLFTALALRLLRADRAGDVRLCGCALAGARGRLDARGRDHAVRARVRGRQRARRQAGRLVGKLHHHREALPLVPIALAGLWFAGWNNLPVAEPRAPDGLANALQLALFACFGFDVASILAGEMRNPRRDLPISILAGLAFCCLLYILLMLACFGVLPDTAASKLPLTDLAQAFLGPDGRHLDGRCGRPVLLRRQHRADCS